MTTHFCIPSVRLGVLLHCPSGFIRYGEIVDPADLAALSRQGYKFVVCDGIPEPGSSPEEQRALAEARERQRKSRRWMGEAARDALAPLRKRHQLEKMK